MIEIFGIRHHGPGSARSLVAAMHGLQPDCVLVEGPPDAADLIPLVTHEAMAPPVALLVYVPDRPQQAAYFPFAAFSPEWQALQFARRRGIPARFIDLPMSHQFALRPDEAEADEEVPHPREDPLRWLAVAAGYSDSERWWEHMVEERHDGSQIFAGIMEGMTALRQEFPSRDAPREALREACMRTSIRAAVKEGFNRVAVVCGAWHAPVLHPDRKIPAKEDAALLKGLARVKVQATWIPWTYGRLSQASGYGAGVDSPGWYDHLWTSQARESPRVAERWLSRVAALLRREDLDASAAQTIDAVRLAEALAALRGRPLPGLPELNDAARSVYCLGSAVPLRLVHEKLIVGETLGRVPDETPIVPLQLDLQRLQKRLRLQPSASATPLELDLRKDNDLERSRLLHRLRLLDLPWGDPQQVRGRGTFKEAWRLRWQPEFEVKLIEAGVWGKTILEAATARACRDAAAAPDLPHLTRLLDRVFLADLEAAVPPLITRLSDEAAVASDLGHLMDALPPLAAVLRYGNVRQTDARMVSEVVEGLVSRTCVGLAAACASLNDDAAADMFRRLVAEHEAVSLLQAEAYSVAWREALGRLADQGGIHGLVAGRAARLLLEGGSMSPEDEARRLSLALSGGTEPAAAAAWVEGFLRGSGLLVIHDERLWRLLDGWVSGLPAEAFTSVLPLLRRTFSTFIAPERRQMGERVRRADSATPAAADSESTEFDRARAEAVLPLLAQILGVD